jgi:IclR family KDG regulon transcriptional repressor
MQPKNKAPLPARETSSGTVSRVLALLSCFGERDQWALGDLSARLGLPKSTTYRLMGLCRAEGFIASLGGGLYGVGGELSRIASLVTAQTSVVAYGSDLIREIASQCQEVAVLAEAIPEKLRMTYVAKAEPSEDFRYHIELNRLNSLCWGACSRAILAHLPDEQIRQAIEEGGNSPSGAHFDAPALLADLETVRAREFCVSIGQNKETAVGIAVPYFGTQGVKGAIGISVPTFRFRNKMVPTLVSALARQAQKLTHRLGGDLGVREMRRDGRGPREKT